MTSQQIRECAAAGVLAGALGLCGCGSGDDAATGTTAPAPAQTATTEAATSFPDGLRGSWRRTLRDSDWGVVGSYPTGRWRMDVGRSGAVSVYLPATDAVDFTTRFVVKGQQLTIDPVPVCPSQTGRYTWRASEGRFTLRVVADPCKERAALFGGRWASRAAGR